MRIRRVLAVFAIATVAVGTGCGGSSSSTDKPADDESTVPPFMREHTVVFEADGPIKADITYNDPDAGEVDLKKVQLPWRKELTFKGDGPVTMTVIIPGFEQPQDPFTCRILIDGKEVSSESQHQYVTCDNLDRQ